MKLNKNPAWKDLYKTAAQLLTTGREQQRSDTLYISTVEQQMSPTETEGNQKFLLL